MRSICKRLDELKDKILNSKIYNIDTVISEVKQLMKENGLTQNQAYKDLGIKKFHLMQTFRDPLKNMQRSKQILMNIVDLITEKYPCDRKVVLTSKLFDKKNKIQELSQEYKIYVNDYWTELINNLDYAITGRLSKICKFHYTTAFAHGYKHAIEILLEFSDDNLTSNELVDYLDILVSEHSKYIESLLEVHNVIPKDISAVKRFYEKGFADGFECAINMKGVKNA